MKLDWNKLSARERDGVVHGRVMQAQQLFGLMKRRLFYRPNACGYTANPEEAGRYSMEDAKQRSRVRGDEDDVTIVAFDPPHYTTEIQFAWLVVERMREKGFKYDVRSQFKFDARPYIADSRTQHVAFFVSIETSALHRAEGATAPEAICLAACRAEGVEV